MYARKYYLLYIEEIFYLYIEEIFYLNIQKVFLFFPAERSAGRREKNLRNAVPVFSLQRLENSAVLAVDRQNRHAAFFCQRAYFFCHDLILQPLS